MEEIKNFKHVVGSVERGKPAVVRFFGGVNQWNCAEFNYEFLYIQDYIQPSSIEIQINSEGGSVLYGMSTYAVIANCPIPTTCVNVGLCASMGSIIWAAGKESKMTDYSILMVHNPFNPKIEDELTADEKAQIDAFKSMMSVIYTNRWGFTEDEVEAIMAGAEGVDGTYMKANDVVAKNIIPAKNVIKTKKQEAAIVSNGVEIEASADAKETRILFDKVLAEIDEFKQSSGKNAILKQENQPKAEVNNNHNNLKTVTMEKELGIISAHLGLKADAKIEDVIAALPGLVKVKGDFERVSAEVTAVTAKYDALVITNTGNITALENATAELNAAKEKLSVFEAAEASAKENAIETLVQGAIDAKKIKAESKESWVTMARTNYEHVQATLESIPAPEKISAKIENNPANLQAKKETSVEEAAAKVKAVVGDNFKFNKI